MLALVCYSNLFVGFVLWFEFVCYVVLLLIILIVLESAYFFDILVLLLRFWGVVCFCIGCCFSGCFCLVLGLLVVRYVFGTWFGCGFRLDFVICVDLNCWFGLLAYWLFTGLVWSLCFGLV